MTGGTCRIAPLGIPTAIIADDHLLLEAAAAPYSVWPSGPSDRPPELTIRLELGNPPANSLGRGIVVEGSRMSLSGRCFSGRADVRLGRAECRVSPLLLDEPWRLTTLVTDPLLLFLLTRSERPPLHAAGVMIGETCAVLAGPSGSGKSTLALAASRRSWPVLAEDMVFIETGAGIRVWGWPGPIHVIEEEAPRGFHYRRTRGGRTKVAVPPGPVRLIADRAVLVVLERGARAELCPVDREAAKASIMQLDSGFDLLRHEIESAIDSVLSVPPLRLLLSGNPDDALDLLEAELAEMACR